ncbi:MAG: hypothetical protein JWR09_2848 [Mucilaginibacter sp.]|nr:hypothetical protein [Mucilaginibacter sp.]
MLIPDLSNSNQIGLNHLITELKFSREKTINLVANLSKNELDTIIGEGFNSIGTLLKHIASNEFHYQLATFEGRILNAEEKAFWKGAITGELSLNLINNNELDYYLNVLKDVRDYSIKLLNKQNDEWLYEPAKLMFSRPVNNYYCWFHVMEDEISHAGQIKVLLKQIKLLKQKQV